jgi:hypothetical protein
MPIPHPVDFNSDDGGSMFLTEMSQSIYKTTQCYTTGHNLKKT